MRGSVQRAGHGVAVVVALLTLLLGLLFGAGPAAARAVPPAPDHSANQHSANQHPGNQHPATQHGRAAVTGVEVAAMVAAGALLLATGVALATAGRRRPAPVAG